MGYRSTRAAQDVLSALIRKGFLAREPNRARALRVLSSPDISARSRSSIEPAAQAAPGIPLLGSIVAGLPEDATESLESTLPVSPDLFDIPKRHRVFALRVRGDSMKDRHFIEGDLVICDADADARHGDVVAAVIDGESTLKTLIHRDGKVWLRAENPSCPALQPAAELTIQGVACGVIRSRV
jgi:repressor LexA